MSVFRQPGACDCHSHVYGPFHRFPLPSPPAFSPPESPIEQLEKQWAALGISRAVLVQGAAYGTDLSALMAAIEQDRDQRRGIAVVPDNTPPAALAELHARGIRGVRFNWSRHLLAHDPRSDAQRLHDASGLIESVAALGWHVELHLDAADLHLAHELPVPPGTPVVIDHMGRIDLSAPEAAAHSDQLVTLVSETRFWIKLSGADRATAELESLDAALPLMQRLIVAAPDRCLWGLDWPHVNLSRRRDDAALAELLLQATGDPDRLNRILVTNPERLYGFPPRPAR